MGYVLASIIGVMIGAVIYFWLPSLLKIACAYYEGPQTKCAKVFDEMLLDMPRWKAVLFNLSGPILSTVLAFLLFKPIWLKFLFIIFFLLITKNLSYKIALYLQKKRLLKIKSQLVEALGFVSNALRSGLSLQQGFQMASEEMPQPISQELKRMISFQQLGKTFDASLVEFKNRVPLEEVELLVSSLIVLRETGGNMIETLEIIIHTIREEQRVKSKIKTLTMQGIAQAVIICVLPFVMAGVLYVISPGYIEPLIEHPIGWAMIAFMLILQGTGMFMMKKIVTIKV